MAEERPEARTQRSMGCVALGRFREARLLPNEGDQGDQAGPWFSGAHNLRRMQKHQVAMLSGDGQEQVGVSLGCTLTLPGWQ